MLPKKIDEKTTNEITTILRKLHIYDTRVWIDLNKRVIESSDVNYSIEDLLEAAGTLSPERGKEVLEELNRSREEWDSLA